MTSCIWKSLLTLGLLCIRFTGNGSWVASFFMLLISSSRERLPLFFPFVRGRFGTHSIYLLIHQYAVYLSVGLSIEAFSCYSTI